MKKQITCLGENNEKYITFTVPMEKQVTKKYISNRLQFIKGVRFKVSSLSNLLNNLSKGIHKIKCKYGGDDKNV